MVSLVQGCGINDADYTVQRGRWICPFYQTWCNMLRRCYNEEYQKRQPTYIGCYVCEEWLVFSKFKGWMELQDWQNKELDKDILVSENKVYGPETCVFVTKLVNTFLSDRRNHRGDWPIGVGLHKQSGLFRARCGGLQGERLNLGYFKTPEEAHQAWLTCKRKLAKILADKQDDPMVAEALIRRYENYSEENKQ